MNLPSEPGYHGADPLYEFSLLIDIHSTPDSKLIYLSKPTEGLSEEIEKDQHV